MKTIKLPNNWDEVYLSQFIELYSLNENDYASINSLLIDKISILSDLDTDSSEIEDMDIDEFIKIEKKLKWLKTKPSQNYKSTVLDNYHLIDFNNITFGEFVDLNYFLSNNQLQNLNKICAILYRRIGFDEYGNKKVEPYSVINFNERSEDMLNLLITEVYGLVLAIAEWKSNLITNFENLFEPVIDETELDEVDEDKPKDFDEVQNEKKEELNSKWGWEQTCYKLANEDISKMDDIFNLPVIFVFNMLSMKKDLEI
jgi:phage-related tail protein